MADVSMRSDYQARLVLEGDVEGSFAAVHVSWSTLKGRHRASVDCHSSGDNIVQVEVYTRKATYQYKRRQVASLLSEHCRQEFEG